MQTLNISKVQYFSIRKLINKTAIKKNKFYNYTENKNFTKTSNKNSTYDNKNKMIQFIATDPFACNKLALDLCSILSSSLSGFLNSLLIRQLKWQITYNNIKMHEKEKYFVDI